ncbi:MAG: DsbE family thiol:disulfide interchange protein [Rhodobacteraceae bacterium]|nr:DsbE family thiol:disulfide interchange protein [Paracoccaceae bacterium]
MIAPLAVFALLAGLFATQLLGERDDSLPSALIAQPVPEFDLPTLRDGEPPRFTSADLAAGDVTVVNLWASWCGPCRVEHPELMSLKQLGVAKLYSINYKDKPAPARRFLSDLGDPFDLVGVDEDGQAALRWGLTGVPETFVIDGAGRVVYKHVGPIQNSDLERKILPAIEAAKAR